MKTANTPTRIDDTIASYSSKGPTAYDYVVKPDIVAPGNQVVSTLAPNASLLGSPTDVYLNEYTNSTTTTTSSGGNNQNNKNNTFSTLATNDLADGSAASPSAVYDPTTQSVSLVNGASVVWGTDAVWDTSVVWGTNVFVNGTSVLWGSSVCWGSSTSDGFSVVWGTG